MRSKLLVCAALAALAISSCKKNDNINPSTTTTNASGADMSYQLTTTNRTAEMRTTAGANLQWTSGYANPSVVKFEAQKGGTEIEYKSTTTAQIDLMSPVAVSFGGFTIPSGTYDKIELKIDLDKNGQNPAMELDGQYSNGTTTFPVQLIITDFMELQTEQTNVTITDNTSFTAVTVLDLSTITAGISETMLLSAKLTNGTLIISSGSNRMIYNMVLDNFRNHRHHCMFEHHDKGKK